MRLRSLALACILFGNLAALPLRAQLPTGRDFRIRDGADGRQVDPRAAAAPDGRFAVVWTTEASFPQEGDVKVRLFDAQGRPRGVEFAVSPDPAHRQAFPAVAMAPNGAFVVTWIQTPASSSASEVFARVFGPGGRPKAPAFRVAESPARKLSADVAMGSDGSFVVAWDQEQADPRFGIVFSRRFGADGRPLTSDLPTSSTFSAGCNLAPRVAVHPRSGDFAVACMTQGISGAEMFVRRYRRDGSQDGDPFLPYDQSIASRDRSAPVVALAADGRVGMAWNEPSFIPDPFPPNLPFAAATVFDGDDRPGSLLQLDKDRLGFQRATAIAALADGAFLATWDSGEEGLFGRLLGPPPSSQSRRFRLGQRDGGRAFSPALGLAPTGRGVVVWNELGPGNRIAIFGRRLEPGTP